MAREQTVSSSGELREVDRNSLMHPFSPLRIQAERDVVVIKEAQGVWLTDDRGRKLLDAAGGLWCVNVGYGRESIVEAVAAQMRKTSYVHSFSHFTHEPLMRLTERLMALAPEGFNRVIYGNSGSDANDTQIKLVRRYNNVLGRPAKKKIISRLSSYHGSTIGSGSLTGLPLVHRTFDLPIDGILHTHAMDYRQRPAHISSEEAFSKYLADELDRLIEAEGPDTVAAFIAEPVVGAGGLLVPPTGYFREINRVLRKHDVLTISDEVITAFGRTGHWFASRPYGMEPDLITVAKGLTSGYLPMSACLLSQKVSDVLYSEAAEDGFFAHGFTSTGHPAVAAGALANLDIIESEGLPQNAAEVGAYLIARLRETLADHELVADIRGAGLMLGIELERDKRNGLPFRDTGRAGSLLSKACFDEGLIVRGAYARALVVLAPPLVLTRAEADEIVVRLHRAIGRFATELAREGLLD